MAQFFTVLTQTGQAKMANAIALGTMIEITQLAVGDGGGSLPQPDSSRETLINEVRRAPINRVEVDADNPNWLVVEQILPPDVGGWTIREVGIFDADGDLIGYGNYPETYKPTLDEGSGRTQTIRMVLEVSHTSAVTLRVDPSVVLATRKYVDSEIDKHAQSRNHPAATESAQGMIQRATIAQAIAGSENSRAMTPSLVHEAFRQFGLGALTGVKVNDLNSIPRSGFYYFTSGALGKPGVEGGVVIHNVQPGYGDERGASLQIVLEAITRKIYFRGYWGGVEEPWREFYSELTFGQADERKKGIVELASPAEAASGEDDQRAVHSVALKAAIDARVASQAETNDGASDSKYVTPKKLKGWVKQATESVLGLLRVATHAQVNAGTDDSTAVTPKKLRWGFSYSFAGDVNYVVMPTWLSGMVVQFGRNGTAPGEVNLPIAFPNSFVAALAQDDQSSGLRDIAACVRVGLTKLELYESDGVKTSAQGFNWIAIGY